MNYYNSQNPNLVVIITHDGQFHADDVLSVAMLTCVYGKENIQVFRTREEVDEKAELYSKTNKVFVIDVGKIYDKDKLRFDHHQDSNLPASCSLILNYIKENDLLPKNVIEKLEYFSNCISNIDVNGYPPVAHIFHVNTFIRTMNNLPNGFHQAVSVMTSFVEALISEVNSENVGKVIWDDGITVNKYIKFCSSYPVGWKKFAKDEKFLIVPHETLKGKFTLHALNPSKEPIVADNATFCHQGLHFAVYDSGSLALDDAMKSLKSIKSEDKIVL